MKGEYLKKTLFQSAHTVGICGHDAIRFLPDDNSVTRSVACNNLKSGYGGLPNIYNHLLYSPDIMISLIKDRFECDDVYSQSGFQQAGTWQFYIR